MGVVHKQQNQSITPTPEDLFKRTKINARIIEVSVDVLCSQIAHNLTESMYEENGTVHSSYVLDIENFEIVYDIFSTSKGIPFVEFIEDFADISEMSADLPLAMSLMLLDKIIQQALGKLSSSPAADDLKFDMENPKEEGDHKFVRTAIKVEGEMIQLISSIVPNDD